MENPKTGVSHKRKGRWNTDNLKTAMDMVMAKKLSMRRASQKYNIPKSTLHDKLAGLCAGKEVALKAKLGRFDKTFSPEYEELLVEHMKDLSSRCLQLTKKEFLKLAYDLAVSLKIPHRFNCEKGEAGKHFYYDFLSRYSEVSLRTPETSSAIRVLEFDKPQVEFFHRNLERLMIRHNFLPSNIFNCNEVNFSCVQKQNIITPKAEGEEKLASAAEGIELTVLFCMSATGVFLPPFFVYPRQKNDQLMVNTPLQSVGVAQSKGSMNHNFFLQWMQHFAYLSHPTKESPVLLLIDGDSNHKTLDVIHFCRDHHIYLMSSPPHTSHKLQPLDSTFMDPFINAYHEQWLRANAGTQMTDYDITGLVNRAFAKVASPEIAVAGFRCTGIYPFDKNIFSDLEYLPTKTKISREKL